MQGLKSTKQKVDQAYRMGILEGVLVGVTLSACILAVIFFGLIV